MKVVLVTESYDSEAPCTGLLKYDILPKNVKDKVDEAMNDSYNSIEMNQYEDGIQFLYSESRRTGVDYFARVGDTVEIIGDVQFFPKY